MSSLLLVFVDGVGLAAASADNPLSVVATPAIDRLLGGPLTVERCRLTEDTMLKGIDACLGVEGLPQSATGQTTLFTGINAPRRLGRHVVAFPGKRLRRLLERHSIFRWASSWGLAWTFANAFSSRYDTLVEQRRLRVSASVWAVRSAAGRLRTVDDLRAGRAVSWDVERDLFAAAAEETVARVVPEVAGRQLAALADRHHLTLFETFLTDLAGHGRRRITAEMAIQRLDGLLGGLIEARTPRTTVIVTSDHGNVEDSSHRTHTRNPVPLLVWGPRARSFARVRSLTGVSRAMRRCLSD